MQKRPFSDEDIERLKVTPYVAPKPLSFSAIALLLLFWPVGLYYLISKGTPEYRLSRCKTDAEREALFAYLKSAPDAYEQQPVNPFDRHRCMNAIVAKPYKSPFADNVYRYGTAEYKAAHGIRS
jgi:hypothetical protein